MADRSKLFRALNGAATQRRAAMLRVDDALPTAIANKRWFTKQAHKRIAKARSIRLALANMGEPIPGTNGATWASHDPR